MNRLTARAMDHLTVLPALTYDRPGSIKERGNGRGTSRRLRSRAGNHSRQRAGGSRRVRPGCRWFDVAALLHQRRELTSTALHARLHTRHRDPLHACGVGLGVTFEVGQLERAAVVGRKCLDERPDARGEFGQGGVLVVEPAVGGRISLRLELGDGHLSTATGPPVVVGDRVASDAKHPGGDTLVVVERPEVLVDAQHHVGDDVVGLVGITDPAPHESFDRGADLGPDRGQVRDPVGGSIDCHRHPHGRVVARRRRGTQTSPEKHPTDARCVSTGIRLIDTEENQP